MLDKLFFKKINSVGLSIFRIFFSVVLFCEVYQLYSFRDIIYTAGEIEVSFIFLFWFPVLVMLFLGLYTRAMTILNYIFSVIIFSSAEAFEYHVFYAYVGINLLLIFLPISRSISIDSLIKKIKYSTVNYRYKNEENVFVINYLFPVFIGIGLVYLDSVFYKLTSPMWMKGLGMWLPANLPMAIWNDFSFIMNNELVVKIVGYSVLVFEMIFIFLFWFKPFRVPFLLIGIALHLGISLVFPLPWFGLTAVGLYLLMVPVSFWKKIFSLFKVNKKTFKFYYDSECPLCNKVIIIIDHFDIFKRIECLPVQNNYKLDSSLDNITLDELLINVHSVDNNKNVFEGYDTYLQLLKHMIWTWPIGFILSLPVIKSLGSRIYVKISGNRLTERCTEENCSVPIVNTPLKEDADIWIKGLTKSFLLKKFWVSLFFIFIFLQALHSWHSTLIHNHIHKWGIGYTFPDLVVKSLGKRANYFSLKYLGLTNHPVFMDNHFDGYDQIVKVEGIDKDGNRELLPIIDDNGMPYANISGAFWVNYTFRTSSPNFSTDVYAKSILPYINFYEKNQNLGEVKLKYEFFVKKIEVPKEWEMNFLKNQMSKPWVKIGDYSKQEEKFSWLE